MNILLINPPVPNRFKIFDYCDDSGKRAISKRVLVGPPLALNELAGVVPDENVYIIDQQAEINANPSYEYIEETIKFIKEFQPDVIGITCLTAQYNGVIKLLNEIKKFDASILTTVGGIHVSSAPQDFIGSGADILSIGIGKHSFYHLIHEYKANGKNADFMEVPGIALNTGKELKYSKQLCELSFREMQDEYMFDEMIPNRKLTDRYPYIVPGPQKRIHYLCTSQGCTHKCNFCYLWKMTNGFYIHKKIDNIIKEMHTMDNYPIIRFADSHTFGDLRRSNELFTRVIDEGLNKKHVFMGDVRCDTVVKHPKEIELARKANLRIVVCGLESVNDEELKLYGKGSGVAEIIKGLHILNEIGIRVNGNYIIRPDYEEDDFKRLGEFIMEHPIYNSALTILTPFPGTEQWDELQDQIVIRDYDYYNLTNCVLKTKLPEDKFYEHIAEIYKISEASGEIYASKYGRGVEED